MHRATFSKSLAEWIVKKYHPEMKVIRPKYKLGKILKKGEKSKGLYGIMSSKKHITLRISMTIEHAELLSNDESRYIQEVFLVNN